MSAKERKNFTLLVVAAIFLAGLFCALAFFGNNTAAPAVTSETVASASTPSIKQVSVEPIPLTDAPVQKILQTDYYAPQTFNNCGPAALSMDLSFFGISASQEEIADDVRPDHNTTGIDDDKSTTPDQLAAEAAKYGLVSYFRPVGTIDLLKQFIANDIPVLVRTRFTPQEDYAHYRVVIGYDDSAGEFIQEDGYQGRDVRFSYDDFMALWKPFNYEYMVIVPPDKRSIAEAILGKDASEKIAWSDAAELAQSTLAENATDTFAGFDLSVADYYLGEYQQSAAEFEKVQASLSALSPHALWYQIEPVKSYAALGDYAQVFAISNAILAHGDPAFPELYVLEGQAYANEGKADLARQSFQTALFFNKNLASAESALASLK